MLSYNFISGVIIICCHDLQACIPEQKVHLPSLWQHGYPSEMGSVVFTSMQNAFHVVVFIVIAFTV